MRSGPPTSAPISGKGFGPSICLLTSEQGAGLRGQELEHKVREVRGWWVVGGGLEVGGWVVG